MGNTGKIGIITINDYYNYGNRLQNYATQEVLTSLGFTAESILNKPIEPDHVRNLQRRSRIDKFAQMRGMPLHEILRKSRQKLWRTLNKRKISQAKELRYQRFKEFSNRYIKETDMTITDDQLPPHLADQYDYFVTGSDQVWNPAFRYGSSIDFLAFAPKHKRIAFSPSFGVSELPPEYHNRYKQWLAEFAHLSVRETAGADIIKRLTGRHAEVLVDPTLLLSREKWLSIAQSAKYKPQKKYLLTYFLGRISSENKRMIDRIAKAHDLVIVQLADLQDLRTYVADPSEFIDYIHSATVFCTDSFHGVVFSILMETPFVVFDRSGPYPSMNSRIDTILSTFQLETRHIRNLQMEHLLDVDYSQVKPILERERNKAYHFLKQALHLDDLVQTNPKEVVSR